MFRIYVCGNVQANPFLRKGMLFIAMRTACGQKAWLLGLGFWFFAFGALQGGSELSSDRVYPRYPFWSVPRRNCKEIYDAVEFCFPAFLEQGCCVKLTKPQFPIWLGSFWFPFQEPCVLPFYQGCRNNLLPHVRLSKHAIRTVDKYRISIKYHKCSNSLRVPCHDPQK